VKEGERECVCESKRRSVGERERECEISELIWFDGQFFAKPLFLFKLLCHV